MEGRILGRKEVKKEEKVQKEGNSVGRRKDIRNKGSSEERKKAKKKVWKKGSSGGRKFGRKEGSSRKEVW